MMEITISQNQDASHVSIMQLRGALDGESYQYFITEAEKLFDAGVRNILVDMSELEFLSSAGLAALHRITRVFRGEDRSTMEEGWSAIHAMGRDRDSGVQEHVKLLSPSENILGVLDTVGFKAFFEIYTDIDQALASFPTTQS
jgi:anti-anti-sigma factor